MRACATVWQTAGVIGRPERGAIPDECIFGNGGQALAGRAIMRMRPLRLMLLITSKGSDSIIKGVRLD